MDALADLIAQARAVRSDDLDDDETATEAATLADMVLEWAASMTASQPAEAR
jgi:hypothetical protein